MVWYRNKAPLHLDLTDPTAQGSRTPKKREIRITTWRVFYVGGGWASKVDELGKDEYQVKNNMVSEGHRK